MSRSVPCWQSREGLNECFHTQAAKRHEFPRYGSRKIKVSTFKSWLKAYRKSDFDALKPKIRGDRVRPRKADAQIMWIIISFFKHHSFLSMFDKTLSQLV